MIGVRRFLFRLCYQLRGHRWNGWPLDYWLALLLVLLAGLASLDVIPGGPAVIYIVAGLLVLLWAAMFWARRHRHIVFVPEDDLAIPGAAAPLQPTDKIEVRATGRFEVEGKEQTFSEILAYFRTFGTREHAVMAIVPPSRFLLLGTWPEEDVGMWYIFFQPKHIASLEPGTLLFTGEPRPALRIVYNLGDAQETVYLSFHDRASRQRIWADLRRDAPAPAH